LLKQLVKLRLFFDENNLYSGNKPWVGCLIVVNLRKAKTQIEFRYDQQMGHHQPVVVQVVVGIVWRL
jgi:hypothetical protein